MGSWVRQGSAGAGRAWLQAEGERSLAWAASRPRYTERSCHSSPPVGQIKAKEESEERVKQLGKRQRGLVSGSCETSSTEAVTFVEYIATEATAWSY